MDDQLNNNNNENIKLYNSVWNNKYLKSIIFKHLNLYNILNVNFTFKSAKEWDQFKLKKYLNQVLFEFKMDLHQLPVNIKQVGFRIINQDFEGFTSVPDHIESLSLEDYPLSKNSTLKSIPKLKYLGLINDTSDIVVMPDNSFPESITKLEISDYSEESYILQKNQFPPNLKELSIYRVTSIERGSLPESLTDLVFDKCTPKVLNQISKIKLRKLEFTLGTEYEDEDEYEDGDEDEEDEEREIGPNIEFSDSLQQLEILNCFSFNTKLPSNLKMLYLSMDTLRYNINFPSTLEEIIIRYIDNDLNKEVFNENNAVPSNLKTLNITCSKITDKNSNSIFSNSNKLVSLTLQGFSKALQVNQLPSTLTYLNLCIGFRSVIDVGVLPSTLKILFLGSGYSKIINSQAIPQQLELLKIINSKYSHFIDLPVSTHPKTIISCCDMNLYYKPSNTQIRVLMLSKFKSPLSSLKLHDKSLLEYLHLGDSFNEPISLLDLPLNNNIKTLELGHDYSMTINLEYFKNLETIIVNNNNSINYPKIISSTINDSNHYNHYSLKSILVSQNSYNCFIRDLDSSFYPLIKLKK